MANLSLSSKRTVRLSPALNMPEELFTEMMNRVDHFAERNPAAGRLLSNTPPALLTRLATFATGLSQAHL